MKLLQINITANWGSHGKIAEGIGLTVQSQGWESYIAYGRRATSSESKLYRIGNQKDEFIHAIGSRLFDNHGLMSKKATQELIQYIDSVCPTIIHLHNIHGYYLNYPLLFQYLSQSKIPIVWTLHDCWPFTGHCAHFMYVNCEHWKTHCHHCPQRQAYPRSLLLDCSYRNFELKKKTFLLPDNLNLVSVSKWLEKELRQSFLKGKAIYQIYNGIDTSIFQEQDDTKVIREKYGIPSTGNVVLGVASNWYRKGLADFIKLRSLLREDITIVVVGLNNNELLNISISGIIGIKRTDSINELVSLYSLADVYFNPTWEDNFPTTNLEAMACGTPVVVYDTGGCSESIAKDTGYVIPKGDLYLAKDIIMSICQQGKKHYSSSCKEWIKKRFNKSDRFYEYFQLYQAIVSRSKSENNNVNVPTIT